MELTLTVLAVLFACAFAAWCFCKTAGDADREADDMAGKSAALEELKRMEDDRK